MNWISVKKRLPTHENTVNVWLKSIASGEEFPGFAYSKCGGLKSYKGGWWIVDKSKDYYGITIVTHWAEIEPPEGV